MFDAHPLDEFFDISTWLTAFFDISTWLTAIVGSVVLLVIYRLVVDRGGHGRTVRTQPESTIGAPYSGVPIVERQADRPPNFQPALS